MAKITAKTQAYTGIKENSTLISEEVDEYYEMLDMLSSVRNYLVRAVKENERAADKATGAEFKGFHTGKAMAYKDALELIGKP